MLNKWQMNNGINIICTSIINQQSSRETERKIRTIIEDMRTLLLQSRLPFRLWTYDVKTNPMRSIFTTELLSASKFIQHIQKRETLDLF